MATIPFWGNGSEEDLDGGFSENPWDIVFLGGNGLPGICEVKPTGISGIEIDKKKPKGSHHSHITILGYDSRTFDVTCKVWTSDQWEFLQAVIDLLWKGPRSTSADEIAITVAHPALDLLKIDTAILIGLTPPVPGPEAGTMVVTFHMHEKPNDYRRGNVTKTPKGSQKVPLTPERQDTPAANEATTRPGSDSSVTGPGV